VEDSFLSSSGVSFGGIFNCQTPGRGGHARWQWEDGDLNQAATKLVHRVDGVLTKFADAGHVWLATIELDLVEGRYPEMFASFFSDPTWDYTMRFYVPEVLKDSTESSAEVGILVCELCGGRLMRLLAFEGGFRWGSALRVGGVQVPQEAVPRVLKGSIFDDEHATKVESLVKYAWAASADLNALAMWTATQNDDWRHRVTSLGASIA
jgi:hypothetical protein